MLRLLVVDDHRVVCSSIQRALRGRFAVDVATSGAEALALLRANEYALVLCDALMPGMSGFELIEVLARESPRALVRLVMMTSHNCTAAELRRLSELGVQVLHKPFGSTELLMLVSGYVARARAG